jgi:hypothetical protein
MSAGDSMSERDTLWRVLAQVQVIAEAPPPMPDDTDATDFNRLLDQLKGIGYSVDDFRILDTDMYRPEAFLKGNGQRVIATISESGMASYRAKRSRY